MVDQAENLGASSSVRLDWDLDIRCAAEEVVQHAGDKHAPDWESTSASEGCKERPFPAALPCMDRWKAAGPSSARPCHSAD